MNSDMPDLWHLFSSFVIPVTDDAMDRHVEISMTLQF